MPTQEQVRPYVTVLCHFANTSNMGEEKVLFPPIPEKLYQHLHNKMQQWAGRSTFILDEDQKRLYQSLLQILSILGKEPQSPDYQNLQGLWLPLKETRQEGFEKHQIHQQSCLGSLLYCIAQNLFCILQTEYQGHPSNEDSIENVIESFLYMELALHHKLGHDPRFCLSDSRFLKERATSPEHQKRLQTWQNAALSMLTS